MPVTTDKFDSLNQNKANFDAIYRKPDPRDYYRVLCGLDYVIPDLARATFRTLAARAQKEAGHRIKILDLGCSYGINSALIRYPLDMLRLAERYAGAAMRDVDSGTLASLDESYFRSWPLQTDATFVGLDTSREAVDYAVDAGILEAAVATNLESDPLTPADARAVSGLGLIVSTGCVGYVTERTFGRILEQQKRDAMPWVANFVLRMFPYDDIASELERFGLITEKLEGVTFVQRRFHSQEEQDATLESLRRRGIDPAGKESEGVYHAELYVSRPKASIARARLSDIVSVTSGADRHYPPRPRRRATKPN
jgi:SAM-dependent methyltransferase